MRTCDIFLRAYAGVYLIAFLAAALQLPGLVGSRGILPAARYLERLGARGLGFWDLPTLFWLGCPDWALSAVAWAGVVLAAAGVAGLTHATARFALWALYLSIVGAGQIFYGYGWESILLEGGFLAIFLGGKPPAAPVVWLYRWLVFRIMFGAGLIKLRGDPCWLDLTCMNFHYETQPVPNPLSWTFHRLPELFHKLEVLGTHFVELVVPFGLFGPLRIRRLAAVLTMAFQGMLILSGNLSWLNWLTIVLCIPCFAELPPPRLWAESLSRPRLAVTALLVAVIATLSVNPALNLFSARQRMNASFESFHLVNTYGAFGSIGKHRNEVVLEGTDDEKPGPKTVWKEYEFKCKPGDPARRPCVVSPYHRRIDWQMWFAAMSATHEDHYWFAPFVFRLLEGSPEVTGLLERNPFPDRPPRHLRALLYEYRFTAWGEPGWWRRAPVGIYLPPVSAADFAK